MDRCFVQVLNPFATPTQNFTTFGRTAQAIGKNTILSLGPAECALALSATPSVEGRSVPDLFDSYSSAIRKNKTRKVWTSTYLHFRWHPALRQADPNEAPLQLLEKKWHMFSRFGTLYGSKKLEKPSTLKTCRNHKNPAPGRPSLGFSLFFDAIVAHVVYGKSESPKSCLFVFYTMLSASPNYLASKINPNFMFCSEPLLNLISHMVTKNMMTRKVVSGRVQNPAGAKMAPKITQVLGPTLAPETARSAPRLHF